jgi:hypothetical protein
MRMRKERPIGSKNPRREGAGRSGGSVRIRLSIPLLLIVVLLLSSSLIEHTVIHPSPLWAAILALAIWKSPTLRLSFEFSQRRGLRVLREFLGSDRFDSLMSGIARRMRRHPLGLGRLSRTFEPGKGSTTKHAKGPPPT